MHELLESRQLLAADTSTALIQWEGRSVEVKQGSWLVGLKGSAGTQATQSVAAKASFESVIAKSSSIAFDRLLAGGKTLEISAPSNAGYQQIHEQVRNLPGFEYLEPNFVVRGAATPSDSSYSTLWGMHNSGQSSGTADADIDAPEAWNRTTGSSSIVVGVIDSGIDYNHPDLVDNMWTNPGEIPGDGLDNEGNGFIDDIYGWDFANDDANPFDDNGHGTHCAGTIGGVGHNGEGVVGVNWDVSIMALKFLDSSGNGYISDAVDALNYAVMMKQRGINLRVTNNSWGGGGFSSAFSTALTNSRNADMLFIAAAGNDSSNNDSFSAYPASYTHDNVIAVAATTRTDARASFSNYGASSVDLGAPGESILSSTPYNSYSTYNGTSMATPHVAGTAALAWSFEPTASAARIRTAILQGGDSITSMSGVTATGKRLNANGTLNYLSATGTQFTPLNPAGSLIYTKGLSGTITAASVITETLALDAAQTVTATIKPSPGLRPIVSLLDSTDAVLATATASAAGSSVVLPITSVGTLGTYRLQVSGTAGSSGTYTGDVFLNAAAEGEGNGGTANDTLATAQNLNGSFLNLGGGPSDRGAVVGTGGASVLSRLFSMDNGFVREINPLSGATIRSFATPVAYTADAGMAVAPNGVLVGGSGAAPIYELNPDTGAVIRTIPNPQVGFEISGLAYVNNEIFVITDANNVVYVLNYATGAVARSYVSGAPAVEGLTSDGTVLLGRSSSGLLYRTNPTTGNGISSNSFSSTAGLAVVGNELFSANGSYIYVYDLTTLASKRSMFSGSLIEALGGDNAPLSDAVDWYSFSLLDGQSATLTLTTLDPDGVPKLDLYDSNSVLLASGVKTGSLSQIIDEFRDATVDAAPNTYYVKLSSITAKYDLTITRSADLETTEPNDLFAGAQEASSVLGSISNASTTALVGNFAGLNDLSGFCPGCEPADVQIAVGPNHVVQAVRNGFVVYNKDGSTALAPQSFATFFGASLLSGDTFQSEPVLAYDEMIGRWYLGAITAASSTAEADFLFAVSNTNDPTGSWTEQKRIDFGAISPGLTIDHPRLGFNAEVVVCAFNVFNSGVFSNVDVLSMSKATLTDANPTTFTSNITTRPSDNFTLVPATMHGAAVNSPMWFVEENAFGGTQSYVRLVRMSSPNTASPSYASFTVMVNSYTSGAHVNVPQPGGAVVAGDGRFTSASMRGTRLVAAHTIQRAIDGENAVRWYEFSVTSAGVVTLRQQGDIDPGAGVHAYFPAIELNAAGDIGIQYLQSSSSEYVSMYAAGQKAGGAAGILSNPALVKRGDQTYPGARIGDYGGIAVDPVDGSFWGANEVSLSGSPDPLWSTHIGRFTLGAEDADYYRFDAVAGDALTIESFTPFDGANLPANALNPALDLYDPAGNLVLSDAASSTDGRNAKLSHVALSSGTYRVRVRAEGATRGEYFVRVSGSTGVVATNNVVLTSPHNGAKLKALPTDVTVTFDHPLAVDSVSPGDLLVGGLPATAVTTVDGKTFRFTVDPAAANGEGDYAITLAAGAVLGANGAANAAYSGTFTLDAVAPKIVSTLWNGAALPASHVFTNGVLTVQAKFSERLYAYVGARRSAATPGVEDVQLVNVTTSTTYNASGISYDSATETLSASFSGVPEGNYTFRLISGDAALKDVAGNFLDGEPLGAGDDGAPSGDGAAGGNYTTSVILDADVRAAAAFTRLEPVGAAASQSSNNTGILHDAADGDGFTFYAQAGQTISAVIRPESSAAVRLTAQITGLTGVFTATSAGAILLLPPTLITVSGTYEIRIGADAAADYSFDVLRNAQAETETLTGASNNTAAGAQDLDAGFATLAFGAQTAVVSGGGSTGRLFAYNATSDRILELNPASGAILRSFPSPVAEGTSSNFGLATTPNSLLLGGSASSPIYELSFDGSLIRTIANPSLDLRGLAFLQDEIYVYTAAGTIGVLSYPTGTLVRTLNSSLSTSGGGLASDGTRLIAASGLALYTVNTTTGAKTIALSGSHIGAGLAFVGIEVFTTAGTTIGVMSNTLSGGFTRTYTGFSGLQALGADGNTPGDSEDWYRFSLNDGQRASLALKRILGSATTTLEFYDADLRLLAVGSAATSPDANVQGFVDRTLNGTADVYYARVVTTNTYQLAVTRNFDFDAESNGTAATAQTAKQAVGYINSTTSPSFTDEDNYRVYVNVGDVLTIETATPLDVAAQTPLSALDPSLELYNPAGTLVVSDSNSGGDGKNAKITHTALVTGAYRIRVRGNGSTPGEYVFRVQGATGIAPAPSVVDIDPDNGSWLNQVPAVITVHFSAPMLISSVDAADLTVGGVAATSVTQLDPDSFRFTIDPASMPTDGSFPVVIAAGAVTDLAGTGLSTYSGVLNLDRAAPKLLSTTWNGAAFPNDRLLNKGPLVVTAQFNEALLPIGVEDVTLTDTLTSATFAPASVAWNSATNTLTATFASLPEGAYTLRFLSADGAFEDLAGNNLDGEAGPVGDGTPSGDGTAGGDYAPNFTIDVTTVTVTDFTRLEPLGSLMSQSGTIVGRVNAIDDVDDYAVYLQAGQTLSAVVKPTSATALLSAQLLSVTGVIVASAPGGTAALTPTVVPTSGFYTLRVMGNEITDYSLDLLKNGALETQVGDSADGNEVALVAAQSAGSSLRLYAAAGHSKAAVGGIHYEKRNDPTQFVDISTTGTPLNLTYGGSVTVTTTVGNAIFPAGSVVISNNGGIVTGSSPYLSTSNSSLPSSSFTRALLPFWSTFDDGSGNVYWQERQVNGVNTLIVQWHEREVGFSSLGTGTIQLQLFQTGTTYARFVYRDVDFNDTSYNNGINATIGIQESTSSARQYSYDTASVTSGDVIELVNPVAATDVDEYTVDLTGKIGHSIDVVLEGRNNSFAGETLQLLDPSGVVVATGTTSPLGIAATNFDKGILGYTVAADGVYTVRVSSLTIGGNYSVVVTDDRAFETEANDSTAVVLRSLNVVKEVAGYLAPAAANTFTTRTSFNAAAPGLPVEDFEEAAVTGSGYYTFGAPLSSTTSNSIFAAGTILPGVVIQDSPGPNTSSGLAAYPPQVSSYGNASKAVGLTYTRDNLDLLFTSGTTNAVGFDFSAYYAGTLRYTAFDAFGRTLRTGTVAIAARAVTFVGIVTESPIAKLTVGTADYNYQLLDNLAFGQVSASAYDAAFGETSPGDFHSVSLQAGERAVFTASSIFTDSLSTPYGSLDPMLRVYNAAGTTLMAFDRDSLNGKDARVIFTAPSTGTYNVQTLSEKGRGEYLLRMLSPGINVAPITPLTVTEAGGTAQFSIALNMAPAADVTIGITSGDLSEGSISVSTLTFTSLNWNVPQIVTVTGVDDAIDDGDVAFTVVTSTAASADPIFGGLNVADIALSTIDDDTAGITVSPVAGLVTTETGGTATFTVVLNSQPATNVSLSFLSSNTSEGTVAPSALTFTPANWYLPRTVTITGVYDGLIDGNVAYTIITSPASSADPLYANLDPADVAVTNLDNAVPGITVTPGGGLITTEAGGTATFTVVLNTIPTASVLIPIASSNPAEGSVSASSLSFTSANWNVPQTVIVTGLNDAIDDGNVAFTIVTSPATSTDVDYQGMNATDVGVVNLDDDTAGIVVTPVSGLSTTEAGGTATFTVVLTSQPTSSLSIALSSSNTGEGTISTSSLAFTAANWNVPQIVTVTGVNEAIDDGDAVYTIVTSNPTGSDSQYTALNPADVAVTNLDDDTAGVNVVVGGSTTTEAGGTATFTVVLTSQPLATVSIGLSSSNSGEGSVNPLTLSFTAANWNAPQTVTVTGQNDLIDDGDTAFTIVTAPTVSTDPRYSGVNPSDVGMTNLDDDTAGITVTPTAGLVTTEAGGTATFTVVLNSQPTAPVNLGLSSSNTLEGTISASLLTFTAANWNVPQIVTVAGVNDAYDDGNVAYAIIISPAASGDPKYANLDPSDVAVSNTDDDAAGIVVTPATPLITTEAGGTATFTLVLTSRPLTDVVIPLASSNLSEGQLSKASITFTTLNWNLPQSVIVTGVNDMIDDGDVAYVIVISPATSSDASYQGINPVDLNATNADDDTAGITLNAAAGLVTSEAGGTATFTLVLNSQPLSDVTVPLSSSNAAQGAPAVASVTFTAANWNVPQTITILAIDDAIDDGDVAFLIVAAAATSADPRYAGVNPPDVSVTNLDNDTAGIVVSAPTGTSVSESGTSVTFTAVLSSQPLADVTIPLSSSDASEGSVSTPSLLFTSANWNVPRTVTVTGVQDAIDDGDVPFTVLLAAATSTDPLYSGVNPLDISLTNLDDDTAGIIVSPPTGATVTEAGTSITFTMKLASQPTADVVIPLAVSDAKEASVSSSLVFTAANWSVPQTVTITGVHDAIDDGDVVFVLPLLATSADSLYAAIDPADLVFTTLDDDVAGIVVSAAPGLTTLENGATAGFDVVLRSQPLHDVTIPVSSSNVLEGTASVASITFTPADWNVPRHVTITGVDDPIDDDDLAYKIVLGASVSGDPLYSGVDLIDLNVVNRDDDVVEDRSDAPDIYPRVAHKAYGPTLGALRDFELIDPASPTSLGDDVHNTPDEDGVFTSPLFAGLPSTFTIDVQNVGAGGANVGAWIDFNHDGDFLDAGEEVYNAVRSVAGPISFIVTPTVEQFAGFEGSTTARFRTSDAAHLFTVDAPLVASGEVEDHPIEVADAPEVLVAMNGNVIEVRDYGDRNNDGDADDAGEAWHDDRLTISFLPEGMLIVNTVPGARIFAVGIADLPRLGDDRVLLPLSSVVQVLTLGGDDQIGVDATATTVQPFPTLEIVGGTGVDRLEALGNTDNLFTLASAAGGTAKFGALSNIAFGEMETIFGGGGKDTFVITSIDAEGITFDGRGGASDKIQVQRNADFTLTDASLRVATGTTERNFTLAGIEQAALTGGTSNNTFTVSGWSGGRSGTLLGGGGTDKVVRGGSETSHTLTPVRLLSNNAAVVGADWTLGSIETADLVAVTANTLFDVSTWGRGGSITATGATNDTIRLNANFSKVTLSDAALRVGTLSPIALAGVRRAVLTGGSTKQTLDMSGWTGTGTFDGGLGTDVIVASGDATRFTADDGSVSVDTGKISLLNVEDFSFTGGNGANTFDVSGWSGTGVIHGNAGTDLLIANKTSAAFTKADFSLRPTSLEIKTTSGAATLTRSIALHAVEAAVLGGGSIANTFTLTNWTGAATVHGAGGSDVLNVAQDTGFTINAASVAAGTSVTALSGIENLALTGGAGANAFTLNGWTGGLSIDGGASADRLLVASRDVNFSFTAVAGSSVKHLLHAGSQAVSINAVETVNLNGGAGANTFDYSNFAGGGSINGQGGNDKVVVAADSSFLAEANKLRVGTRAFPLTNVESLNLTGGAGNNTFTVNGWIGGLSLGGGNGVDTVVATADTDFTLYDSALKLANVPSAWSLSGIESAVLNGGASGNLLDARGFTGSARLTGNAGDDKLWGGSGNDILTGGDGNDQLLGGAGNDSLVGGLHRDLLIGGGGVDSLAGSDGEDLLLAGSTAYDANQAALDAILAAWTSASAYADRVKLLNATGVGPTKQYKLSGAALLDDALTDSLLGGKDNDWFFAEMTSGQSGLENPDETSGETVTDLN